MGTGLLNPRIEGPFGRWNPRLPSPGVESCQSDPRAVVSEGEEGRGPAKFKQRLN
jgi:hypothetical protein